MCTRHSRPAEPLPRLIYLAPPPRTGSPCWETDEARDARRVRRRKRVPGIPRWPVCGTGGLGAVLCRQMVQRPRSLGRGGGVASAAGICSHSRPRCHTPPAHITTPGKWYGVHMHTHGPGWTAVTAASHQPGPAEPSQNLQFNSLTSRDDTRPKTPVGHWIVDLLACKKN